MFGSQSFKWYHNPVKMDASRKRVRKMLRRLRHRRDMCKRYKISVAEYERRFLAWRRLRKMYIAHLAAEKGREERRNFGLTLKARRKQRQATRTARAEVDALLNAMTPEQGNGRLKAVFPGDD